MHLRQENTIENTLNLEDKYYLTIYYIKFKKKKLSAYS